MLTQLVGIEIASFIAAAQLAVKDTGQVLGLVEQAARQAASRIGQAMIQQVVRLTDGHSGPTIMCDCGQLAKCKGRRPKAVVTMSGPVSVKRAWYHCATCHHGFAPADHILGLSGKTSPGLAKACSMAGMELPFAKATQLVEVVAGTDLISASGLARSTRQIGRNAKRRADVERDATSLGQLIQLPLPGLSIKVAYMLADGTGAPMVPAETVGRAVKNLDNRTHTREIKIGCFSPKPMLTRTANPSAMTTRPPISPPSKTLTVLPKL